MKTRWILFFLFAFGLTGLFISPARAQDELFLIASNEPPPPGSNRAVSHYNASTGVSLGYLISRTDAGMSDFHWGGTFGPDGNFYSADYFGGFIAKFHGTTGAFLGYFVPPGGVGAPVHIRFGPDGYLYVAANGGPAVVRFNGTTGAYVDTPVPGGTPNLGYPQDLVFGADGKLYISTFGTSAVLRYDPQTGTTETFVGPYSGGLSEARQMAFGPDGNLYVSSQNNSTVKKYSGVNGEYLGDFIEAGHIGNNLALTFSPDGNYLYVSGSIPFGSGHGVSRYDGHTGAFIDYFIDNDSSANLGFHNGELYLLASNDVHAATGAGAVSHYNASTAAPLGLFISRTASGMSDFHWGGTFGPDGNLYIADYYGGFIAKFHGSTGAFLGYFVPPGGVGAPVHIRFGPDGYLYVAANGGPAVVRFNGTTGEYVDTPVPEETENLGYPQDLVFGADGKLYISTFGTSAVLRYDPQTGTTETFVQPFSGDLSSARQMAFGPDGNLYVSAQDNSTVKKYSGVTGEYLGDFIEPGVHVGNNLALAFSPDGNYLYVSGSIPVGAGHGVVRYDGHTGDFIDYFIVGDSTANLLFNTGRTNTGSNVAVSPTPTTSLAFSNITAGGQTVVTPLNDGATPLPENFLIPEASGGLPTYFDISTTAIFTGSVTLGIGYDATVFRSDINPTGPDPRLLHYDNGTWVDITTTFDTVAHKVYGVTSSFSPFAIVKRAAYSWSGVLQPINADGSSIFKKGSTIPVKFKLTETDASITSLKAKLYLSQTDSVDPTEANEAVSTSAGDTGNTFRYNATEKQYIFNLSTKSLTQGTWYLRIDLGDGVSHIVQIKLKK